MLDTVERHLAEVLGATTWHSVEGTDPLAEPVVAEPPAADPIPAEVGTAD